MQFLSFALRRLLGLVVAAGVASLLIFFALHILPGDAASVLGGTNATPEEVAKIRQNLGLDKPIILQFLKWVSDLVRLDFGIDSFSGRTISSEFFFAFSKTLSLTLWALLFSIIVGIVLPIVTFYFKNNKNNEKKGPSFPSDIPFVEKVTLFLSSVPAVFLGTALILLLGKGIGVFKLFPTTAISSSFSVSILPGITAGIIAGARLLRFTTASLFSDEEPFVLNYAAIGHSRKMSTLRSGFRAKMGPVVSVTILTATELMTGVVILEKMFAINGIGSELIRDVLRRDLFKVQSEVFLFVLMVLVVGFILDILIAVLDPRVVKRKGAHVKTVA